MNPKIEPVHVADEEEVLPPEPPERTQTLFFWAAVTTLGLFVFNLYFQLLLAARLNAVLGRPPGQATTLAILLVLLPEGVSQGFILGLAQWFVLRRYVKSDYRWIAASILGWTIFYGLYFIYLSVAGAEQAVSGLGNTGALLLVEIIRGLVVGACQWLALRSWGGQARLWIGVVIVAQIANLLVSRLLSVLTVAPALGWMANGLVTGLGIVYLLHVCWAGLLARGEVVEN